MVTTAPPTPGQLASAERARQGLNRKLAADPTARSEHFSRLGKLGAQAREEKAARRAVVVDELLQVKSQIDGIKANIDSLVDAFGALS